MLLSSDKEDNTIDALHYNPDKEDNTIDALRYNPDKEESNASMILSSLSGL
jgi:hypothetical protein